MAPLDATILGLLFPAVAATTGTYLIFRGMGRFVASRLPVTTGRVRCKNPVKSLATGRDCAFSRTVIESYKGGRWHLLYEYVHGAPFMLGGRVVEGELHLTLSTPQVVYGTIPHEKGILETGTATLKNSAIGRLVMHPFSRVIARFFSPDEPVYGPLDAAISARLQRDANLNTAIKRRNARLLKITEHVLAQDMVVCVIAEAKRGGATGPLKGTTEFPLILSDMKPKDAAESLRGRSWLSVFTGAALILLSVLLFASLLAQL